MPFLHIERYESIAHCGELLSATRGVLFVLKTPFFAKKIQKHEILPCNKLLFSLSVQNEEISYKNSWFRIFFVRNSFFWGICDKLTWKLVKYIGKIHELPEHAIHMSRCKVSGCEFSTKSDEWFSSWRGRLQSTSMSTIGWRGHRVRFPPAFQHFSRKYQHPPTNIFDMAPHIPGVLHFGKLSKNQ